MCKGPDKQITLAQGPDGKFTFYVISHKNKHNFLKSMRNLILHSFRKLTEPWLSLRASQTQKLMQMVICEIRTKFILDKMFISENADSHRYVLPNITKSLMAHIFSSGTISIQNFIWSFSAICSFRANWFLNSILPDV